MGGDLKMVGAPSTLSDMLRLSVYRELRETVAVRSRPIVAFVGAGLSAPAGLPSWLGLKAKLVEELREKAARAASLNDAKKMGDEADAIASMGNYWVAFGRLEAALGKTTYQAIIRNSLSPADTLSIPSVYDALWRTPIQGVLSVNLDNFVKRSFSEVYPGKDLKWFTGTQAARLAKILHAGHSFAYSLHGSIDDAQSWVFNHEQLRALYKTQGYRAMLNGIFTSYTVLFLGISADDIAVGGPLEQLARAGIQGPTHYWLTDRNDSATDVWAENAGIRLLPYTSIDNNHSIVIEILKDLSVAVGTESEAPPVLLSSGTVATQLPSPQELVVRPLPEIRRLLNDRAMELLEGPDGEESYEKFLMDYEEAVHRAWFIPSAPGQKELFGYELGELVARGAFGQVYRSIDPQGREVAVKILLEEISHDIKLRNSFRRGVQAMRILEQRHVPGMVAYELASEVPAFVAMEWIEGPNLAEAKAAGTLDNWTEILWVSYELVTILKRAHDLPERVLHRDVRPANVMLRNGWLEYADWQLMVLDFDLSTYRGARQKSVLSKESALGFLAPEQLESEHSPYSTRNAAVDSFGVGMTLLFLCSGTEPEAYAQRRPDFASAITTATCMPKDSLWRSLPRRFARLILEATRDEQPRRLDLAQIQLELKRLQQVHVDSDDMIDVDLLCEEVAARCMAITKIYEWKTDDDCVIVQRPNGLELRMRGAREEDKISLIITWAATGVEDRGSVSKYLPEKLQRSASTLRSGPWEAVRYEQRKKDLILSASLNAEAVRRKIDDAANTLSKAIDILQFH
jgi:eukaryotic-like serine/threonine-protein kinase